MEAVPRLPMIGFEMLTCTKKVSFTHKIEKYINAFYHEDPASYHTEIQALDSLRISAVWPSVDINSCQAMKKYFCQLHYMKSRFPMEENQPVALQFSWKDEYSKMSCTVPDVGFEEMCILFNIGALHAKLGAADSRSTPDGMKMACTHFQCAAWAFQAVREQYAQYVGVVIANVDIVRAMELLCLAQAQECILEKSLLDNRKAAVVVKVAAELSTFYFKAHKLLVAGDDAMLYEHLPQYKYLVRYVQFKIAHYRCVALLYAGQQAEEQQQMGARVAYYQTALEALEEARSCIGRMPGGAQQQAPFNETVTFTWDVVEGKRKAAVNENEFIYHEEVPQVTGPGFDLKGASLVKGIAFSVTDTEVSGPDIFARLIPMVAHEASSIYSEQKASLLRYVAEEIDTKDQQLQEFLTAVQLDFLTQMKTAKGLTQELVDRAAAINAKPDAVKDLIEIMSKLSNSYHEVASMLSEIQELFQEEDKAESDYQGMMGKRPQSNVLTDLRRESAKYQEAHSRASESNEALHKAMTSHVSNLKVLAQPLGKLQEHIPCFQLPDKNVDDEALKKLEVIVAKVEEMKTQRSTLWTQFRDELHKDDITPLLVTTDLDMDDLFKSEMKKHKKMAELLKQNFAAQENIKSALTNSYAEFNDSRKYILDVLNKRNNTITALVTSYDTYGDLLAKAQKGIEFYSKLESNVIKLLQRVRSTSKVQQEERSQLLIKAGQVPSAYQAQVSPAARKGPKLKDYLESRKSSDVGITGTNLYNKQVGVYPPGVRPTPVGADAVTVPTLSTNETTLSGDCSAELAGRMAELTMAQQYWQAQAGNNIPVEPNTYAYSQKTITYDPTQLNKTSNVNNYNAYSTSSTAYNNTNTVTAASGYNNSAVNYNNQNVYTTPYSNTAEFGPVSAVPVYHTQIQPFPPSSNAYASNNQSTQLHNTSTGAYSNNANNTNVSTPSAYNSAGYEHIYRGYNTNQTNATATTMSRSAIETPYATSAPQSTYNSTATVAYSSTSPMVTAPSYYNTPVSQANSNDVSTNNYGAGQQQYYQYTPGVTYNAGNLPLSSTQTTSTTSTAVSTADTAFQAINSGYNSIVPPSYTTDTTAPIRSHAAKQTPTDPNYYGHQNNSNYYGNYMCQTTAGYNYYNQTYPAVQSQNQTYTPENQTYARENQSYPQVQSENQTYPTVQPLNVPPTAIQDTAKKASSVDLLAGLDFSINHTPLVPQKQQDKLTEEQSTKSPQIQMQPAKPEANILPAVITPIKRPEKPSKREPFRNANVVGAFTDKALEFLTFVDALTDKNLAATWKDVVDSQEAESVNRSISVARCYPLKNRCADTLPYDFSRVELTASSDDYINASKIFDLNEYIPNFIVTQTPMKSTLQDFWDMIWEQDIETIVCLLSDSDLGEDIYWPSGQGINLNLGNKVIGLQSTQTKINSIQRKVVVNIPEKRETKYVTIFQFISWTKSVAVSNAEPFLTFIRDVLLEYDTQKFHSNPILVHCLSGIGRSGCFCLLVAIMNQVNSSGSCPNIVQTVSRMSSMRKNILRDREHLKFAYNTIALFYKELIAVYNSAAIVKEVPTSMEADEPIDLPKIDPLSTLDPLWATRK